VPTAAASTMAAPSSASRSLLRFFIVNPLS
jgi:hypothetical protein